MREKNAAAVAQGKSDIPAGKHDVTVDLRIDTSEPKIDFAKGELSVTARLRNTTTDRIVGPIDLQVAQLVNPRSQAMGLKNFKVANADNKKDGDGAIWTFNGSIEPNGKSEPRILRFSFEGGIPKNPNGYFEPVFNIYAGGREASGGAAATGRK